MGNYIAVELKVIEGKAPAVARAAAVAEDRILAGLVRLWHRCWSGKIDTLGLIELAGVFGGERIAQVVEALVAFGFLDPRGDAFRVRGSERYLRLSEARRRGGLASVGNLKRGTERPGPKSRESAGSQPGEVPGSAPALAPSTEHRAPNREDLAGADAPPKKSRKPKSELPPDPRHHPLKLRLVAEYERRMRAGYGFASKDGAAITQLLALGTDEEIMRRWRHALDAQFIKAKSFWGLCSRWNDLGAPESTGKSSAPAASGIISNTAALGTCASCGTAATVEVWGAHFCRDCGSDVVDALPDQSEPAEAKEFVARWVAEAQGDA